MLVRNNGGGGGGGDVIESCEPRWLCETAAPGIAVTDRFEKVDIMDGSENILRSCFCVVADAKGCREFARDEIADDGDGKSSGGAGRVWNSVTATDSASS